MSGRPDRVDGPTAGPTPPARRRSLARPLVAVLVVAALAAPAVRTAVVLAGPPTSDHEVRAQLRFLDAAVADGGAERMQALFPEGFAFVHALRGDAWAGLAGRTGRTEDARLARDRCLEAVAALRRPAGTAPFAGVADPANGVFWAGWSLLLRADAAVLAQRVDQPLPPTERAALAAAVDELSGAFERSTGPFLPSYPGQAWPVDSVVALAALRRAAPVAGRTARVDAVVQRWLAASRAYRDRELGVLPHRVDLDSGRVDGPRATSQALVLALLPEVDPAAARRDWAAFRSAHLGRTLGFPSAREYPRGRSGQGDVDSGPLVLGASLPATVVALGAARANGDPELERRLDDVAEVAGLPLPWPDGRRYAAGLLPVGDAFLAWARTRPAPTGDAGRAATGIPLWAAWTLVPLAGAVAVLRLALGTGRRPALRRREGSRPAPRGRC